MQVLADATLALHVAIVAFVVLGLVAILVGNLRHRWGWVNAVWFRLLHLATIGFVVAEAWLGITCPLTTLESWLRTQARQAAYDESFLEYWLTRLLYYQAPGWVFTLAYTLFGLAIVVTWVVFPPQGRRRAA